VRTLFAALLVNVNKPLAIHSLMDELWTDGRPATATATLRTHVYHLRQALAAGPAAGAEGPVVTTEAGYELRLPEDAVDARVWLRLTERGRLLLDRGHVAEAASVLAEALSLWRGNALCDVRCGPLLRRHAVQLEETRINALQLRIEADLRLGRSRQLIPELRSLVIAHPLNEWLHTRYAESLYLSGRRGEALQAFASLREILKERLGLDPSPEMRRLQQRILLGLELRPDNEGHYRSRTAG
jgi:DNA-binding SARP family transcriptional activator